MRRSLAAAAACACATLGVISGAASGAVPSWTTYRHDALRTGVDPDSGSPVAPAQVWQTNPALDGEIYGSPLVYGTRVYVATENNTVYALDAASGAVVWQRHVAEPVPDNNSATVPCGNIGTVGITGTPVIDPVTNRIFAVADTWDGSHTSSIRHLLVGLNLGDGSPAPGLPSIADAPGSNPRYQLQRPGLALDGRNVIIGYGGYSGDCGDYHGWVVAAPETGGLLQSFFEVLANASGGAGAVWGSGNGLPVDGAGDVWASTGNGFGAGTFGYQESVLKLDPNMNRVDSWTPSNWASLDSGDADLGSSEPLLLPGGLVFAIGKEGVGDLLGASHLGGGGAAGDAPVFSASVCHASFGGGIYVNGVVYLTCTDGIHALTLDLQGRRFSAVPAWQLTSGAIGPPIFAGGLVWSAGWADGKLYGLDPATGSVKFSQDLGSFDHFATPAAAGGRLFVANGDKVTALQIATPPAPPPPPPAKQRSLSLSRVRISTSRRTLTVRLTLSASATVRVTVNQRLRGRRARGRCRRRATRGRHCTSTVRKAAFVLKGKPGANTFRLHLRGLRASRYLLTVTGQGGRGTRSRTYTLGFKIKR